MDFFSLLLVLLSVHWWPSYVVGMENEPVCSKYPYEEQLLGKITRVQIQMEQWDRELKKFEETIMAVLEHRREEMSKLVSDQKKQMTTFLEESKKQEQEKQEKTMKTENISVEYSALQDKISNLTEEINVPVVAFNAYLTTGGSYTENQIIKFSDVLLNDGNGYDVTSGYFTAPVSGLYQFTAHVCCLSAYHMAYAIVHGETELGRSCVYERGSTSCVSVGAVAIIQSGERVFVKSKYFANRLYADSKRWPSFVGVLLHKINN